MNKTLGLLSICRKAGKLTLGMDPVKDSMRNGSALCVLVAQDTSEKSRKEILFFAQQDEVPVYSLDATIEDVWASLGRKAGIISVSDSGFTKKLKTMLEPLPYNKK